MCIRDRNIQGSDSGLEVKTFGIAIHIARKVYRKACLKSPVEKLYPTPLIFFFTGFAQVVCGDNSKSKVVLGTVIQVTNFKHSGFRFRIRSENFGIAIHIARKVYQKACLDSPVEKLYPTP